MSDCDLLTKGDLIKSRWRITHKIGGGGFGQIYQAYDKLRRELIAIKVESNTQPRQGIRMEVTVLRRIQNREHVCELISAGISTLYNYMVMSLLGSSLSELRRNLTDQCFTLSTSLRISLQILNAIQSIHDIGFLHRDIKPSNFAIGRKDSRQIFILDFGLARKFTDYDQHVRPARTEAGFRGTIRYASINAHNNRELGRHDDLWSFFYMLVEFLVGSLPWSKIKDKQNVGHMKETYDYTRFLTYLPDEFDKFLEHINHLHYEDKPDYDYLRSLFQSSIQRLGYQDNDPYDWEIPTENDQTDSSPKIQLDRNTNIKRDQSRSPTPQTKHSQLIKSTSRINFLGKQTDSRHNPIDIGGDQCPLIQTKASSQPDHRSLSSLKRRSTHLNIIDRSQTAGGGGAAAAANGLLTYVSQQFSNAAAPGTPSIFSQWSPHNGETLTDDEILKSNKRMTQCEKNLSDNEQNNQLPMKHQSNSVVPFGTYTNLSQRTSFRLSRKNV